MKGWIKKMITFYLFIFFFFLQAKEIPGHVLPDISPGGKSVQKAGQISHSYLCLFTRSHQITQFPPNSRNVPQIKIYWEGAFQIPIFPLYKTWFYKEPKTVKQLCKSRPQTSQQLFSSLSSKWNHLRFLYEKGSATVARFPNLLNQS